MLFSIELWRQLLLLMFPPIQACDGALRSVVIRVTGCRMTKILEQLYGMQTHQGVLSIDVRIVHQD